jgi:nucleotide-binding universal stress UspA family protein
MTRPVIAGVDGSPASLVAAQYAAEAAHHRSHPLHLVHGYLHPFGYGIPVDPYAVELPAPPDDAERMLKAAAEQLRDARPGLVVQVRQVPGGPAATLVEESLRAELVVVGSRGRGGFAGLLLGSVSAQVAGHAHCPVLVVRPADRVAAGAGPVVVGVDGSPGSEPALTYAADEAARRGRPLAVVHAWWIDAVRHVGDTFAEADVESRAAATDLVAAAAERARQMHPGLAVEQRLEHSLNPEHTLVAASRDAVLVVVGSRGRGGFTGLLLGSVSQALIHHAECPVVIAHPHGHRG